MKEIMQNGTISGFSDPAARLVRKGSKFASVFCGLSPPVLPRPPKARRYTFGPADAYCNQSSSDSLSLKLY